MKRLYIVACLVLTSVNLFAQRVYHVGDYYNENGKEGVVFEVWDGGKHGKIVSIYTTTAAWDSRVKSMEEGYTNGIITYADSESDGRANTDRIMARSDREYFEAFVWCRSMGDDWYLPALNELTTIYDNKDVINITLEALGAESKLSSTSKGVNNKAIILSASHCSSTEYVADDYDFEWMSECCAFGLHMYTGSSISYAKYSAPLVRAVSTF